MWGPGERGTVSTHHCSVQYRVPGSRGLSPPTTVLTDGGDTPWWQLLIRTRLPAISWSPYCYCRSEYHCIDGLFKTVNITILTFPGSGPASVEVRRCMS